MLYYICFFRVKYGFGPYKYTNFLYYIYFNFILDRNFDQLSFYKYREMIFEHPFMTTFSLILTLLFTLSHYCFGFCAREMIFVQPFSNNFLSHTHIIFLFSLFLFLSLLSLTNQRRENQSCHKSCTKELYKYHYSLCKYLLFLCKL